MILRRTMATKPVFMKRDVSDTREPNISYHTPSRKSDKIAFGGGELQVIQRLLSRYVYQILHGCGNSACTQVLCATGWRNTSDAPVRRYTPRSARAIALTIISGPSPRAKLCPHCNSDGSSENPTDQQGSTQIGDGQVDRTSLSQQLYDTQVMRDFCLPMTTDSTPDSHLTLLSHQRELYKVAESLHSCLDDLELVRGPSLDVKSMDALCTCLRVLLSQLSTSDASEWLSLCYDLTQHGLVAPDQPAFVPHRPEMLRAVTVIGHEPLCRVLSRIVDFISTYVDTPESLLARHCGTAMQRFTDYLAERMDKPEIRFIYLSLWLKRIFLMRWDSTCFISPSLSRVLDWLCDLRERYSEFDCAREGEASGIMFLLAVQSRIELTTIARTWIQSRHRTDCKHILKFPGLFSNSQLIACFRTMNHLKMQQAHSHAQKSYTLHTQSFPADLLLNLDESALEGVEESYLLLKVRRGNVLQDTFDQIWLRSKSELLKPLRVRLGEVDNFQVGHDMGGVQIEFFNILCKELFKEENQIFSTNPETGLSYFQPCSLQPLHIFEMIGILFSLAVFNGIALPVNLPRAFYHRLLSRHSAHPSDVSDYWPQVSRSLASILNDKLEDIDAVYPLEANGLRLEVVRTDHGEDEAGRTTMHVLSATRITHGTLTRIPSAGSLQDAVDGTTAKHDSSDVDHANANGTLEAPLDLAAISKDWPGWYLKQSTQEPETVTSANRNEFVRDYIEWVTAGSLVPQWKAFEKGFFTCVDHATLETLFTPKTLAELIEGTTRFDISELLAVTIYEGFDAYDGYIMSFWRIVSSWTEKRQRQLLKFVTAMERIPAGGTRHLTFKISKWLTPDMESLPTSSTCFSTLMLPEYADSEMLERKLLAAIEYGMEGFGTG